MKTAYLLPTVLLSLLATSCVESKCPDGTIEFEGRCIEGQPNPDAGPDGEMHIDCVATCGGATPVCDTSAGVCVACVADEQCGGATPACDLASNKCVACADDTDCDGATPACHPLSKTCVACTDDMHCGGATAACNQATATCVGCTSDTHCAATNQVCDMGAFACVGCLDSGDCGTPSAPVCNTQTKSCGGCQSDNDCARFGSTPVCNEASGQCVACTPDTEAARCGANSCSETTFTCTSTPRRSVVGCMPCGASSECAETDSICVRYRYSQTPETTVCLPNASNLSSCGGEAPFVAKRSATRLDGTATFVCAPNLTTCPAFRAYAEGRVCSLDGDCGVLGSCENFAGIGARCSYTCANTNECAVAHQCSAAKCRP